MKKAFGNLDTGAIFTYLDIEWKKIPPNQLGSVTHNAVRNNDAVDAGTGYFAPTTVVSVVRADHRLIELGAPFVIRSHPR